MHSFNLDISENSKWITALPVTSRVLPFYLLEAGRFEAGSGYYTERAEVENHILIYTLGGRGRLEMQNGVFALRSGDAVLLDCRKHHIYKSDGGDWTFLWAHIDGVGVGGIDEAVNAGATSCVRIRSRADFEELFEELTEKAQFNDMKTLSQISVDIHRLLNIMLGSGLGLEESAGGANHISDIENAVKYMESNYGRQINVDSLVREAHLSKYYFIRLFKQYMGVTPYSYLLNYRINRAKVLLRTTNMSIAEIGAKTGFLDNSNFIANFRRQSGQTPAAYRRDFSIV